MTPIFVIKSVLPTVLIEHITSMEKDFAWLISLWVLQSWCFCLLKVSFIGFLVVLCCH